MSPAVIPSCFCSKLLCVWARHLARPLSEFDVVVNDEHSVHWLTALSDAIASSNLRPEIYKTLQCLTNLDRTAATSVLESDCSEGIP